MPDSDQTHVTGQRPSRWLARVGCALVVLAVAGCQTTPQLPGPEATAEFVAPKSAPAIRRPKAERPGSVVVEMDTGIWARIRAGIRLHEEYRPRIWDEVDRLRTSAPAFEALMRRPAPYMHYILSEIERRGLPTELALLPAVESGFRPEIASPNGAAGLWQFMPATGRMMGLQQDWWYDGRRDITASTQAALDYLERLYKRFDGNWLHALAAYNAGDGTVSRAIRKARSAGKPTDFWSLDLPGETDHYIPRLLALAEVVREPDRYGLVLPEIADTPYFAVVDTAGPIDLQVVAELAQVDVNELRSLNPGLNRTSTPPQGPHHILVPESREEQFLAGLTGLPDNARLRWNYHLVRAGDTLGAIAQRYDVSLAEIRQANNLSSNTIRSGSRLRIPHSQPIETLAAHYSPTPTASELHYEVRRGDSLYAIARQFQVSVDDLTRWNGIDTHLQPGQMLVVYLGQSDPVL